MQLMEKVKYFFNANQSRVIISVAFILIGIIGFGLGFLSAKWSVKIPITVSHVDLQDLFFKKPGDFKFVASKTGENYYPKNCSLADKLKPENIIEFITKEEAESFGFKQSLKCRY